MYCILFAFNLTMVLCHRLLTKETLKKKPRFDNAFYVIAATSAPTLEYSTMYQDWLLTVKHFFSDIRRNAALENASYVWQDCPNYDNCFADTELIHSSLNLKACTLSFTWANLYMELSMLLLKVGWLPGLKPSSRQVVSATVTYIVAPWRYMCRN